MQQQEIDYQNEAKNAIRFRNQFQGIEWIKVSLLSRTTLCNHHSADGKQKCGLVCSL